MAATAEVYSENEIGARTVKENSSRKDKTQLEYTYLIYCLLSESRWHSLGNTKWASYYRDRARAVRLRIQRRKLSRIVVRDFDWRLSLGLESQAVTTPVENQTELVAA